MTVQLRRWSITRIVIAAISIAMVAWALARLLLPDTAPGIIEYAVTNADLPLKHDQYVIQAFEPDGGRLVASSNGTGEPLSVPAGEYDIRASITASFPAQVELRPQQIVRAGRRLKLAFNFSYGELDVHSTIATPQPSGEVLLAQVFPAAKRDAYVAAFEAGEVVKLGAGNYDVRVVSTVDSQEQHVRWYENVTIEPGRRFRLVSTFEQGFVTIEADNAGEPITADAGTVYVYGAGDPLLKVVDAGPVGMPLTLPVGSYDLEVEYSAANDRPTQKINSISVSDQKTTVAKVEFRTGTVLLGARVGDESLSSYEAYAYVYKRGDHRVAVAYAPAGQILRLTEGRYDYRFHLLRSADKLNIWEYDKNIKANSHVEHEVMFESGYLLVRALDRDGSELTGDETAVAIFARGEHARPIARTVAGASVLLGIGGLDVRVRNTYTGEVIWKSADIRLGNITEPTFRFGSPR